MLIALKRLLSSCLPIDQVWSEERKASGVLQRMSLGPGKNTENPTMMQFFTWDSRHPNMTWWQHLAAESSQLAEYGITQIWLPPAHKGLSENSVGYDAYDLWDLGEFNQKGTVSTRWGSKDQLVEAIRIARENGIDVLLDAVLNHKLGGDRTETFKAVPVDGNNRMKEIGPAREIEGWTAFDFPGRFGKYSALRWTQEHFTGVDWDHRTRTNAVYRIIGEGHKGWSPNADKELGNYDYLLGVDIDHRHPAVREDLFNWAQWSLETTGATGFRLDAIKHYDRTFLLEWVRKIRASNSEHSRSFMVAEYWSVNIKLMLEYLRAMKGEVAFFDKHLHDNFHNVCKQGPVFDLRTIFKGTLVNTNPHDAVTFVDNHDTQPGQSLESWVNDKFKLQAYALILLRGQGHPCVFYGDVYPNNDCYEPAISDAVIRLMKTRKSHAFGKLTEFFEHKNCIGFARAGDAKHPGCVVVLSNSSPDASTAQNTISAKLGSGFVNTRFIALFEPHGQVDVPANGIGRFTCPPGSLQVWIPEPSQAS